MRYKVLTVDDSKTVRIIVKKAFKGYDCEIIEAANGVEGLAAAAKETPDLILLDITMPVMDGVELLRQVREDAVHKHLPFVMMTGFPERHAEKEAHENETYRSVYGMDLLIAFHCRRQRRHFSVGIHRPS